MSEQLPPVGDYFGLKKRDIASEIRHNDEFWAAVAQAEVYLNADVSERDDDPTTQETSPDASAESYFDEAVDIVAEALEIPFYDQPVRIVGQGLRYETDEATGEVSFTDPGEYIIERGELCGLITAPLETPRTVQTNGRFYTYKELSYHLGIIVNTDDEMIVFPLRRSTIDTFELWDIPENERLHAYFTDLTRMAKQTRVLTHEREFYMLTGAEQADILSQCLQSMNQSLEGVLSDDNVVHLTTRRYIDITAKDGLPSEILRCETDQPISLEAPILEFVIPELAADTTFSSPDDFPYSQGEPLCMLHDPNDGRFLWVACDDVEGFDFIYNSPERQKTDGTVDLCRELASPNNQAWLEAVYDAAERANDSGEVAEIVREMLPEFESRIGRTLPGAMFIFEGVVVVDNGTGDTSALPFQNETVVATGCDLHFIDGRWQLGVDVEVIDSNSDTVEGFVLPSRTYCTRLELVEQPEPDKDLIRTLTHIARRCHQTTHSPGFKRASLDKQHRLLDASIDHLDEIVREFAPTEENETISCLAKGYLCQPSEFVGIVDPVSLPYVTQKSSGTDDFFHMEGDVIGCGYPEIDLERQQPYKTPEDFPISKGEPMIFIENTATGMAYFVRARDVRRLSPTYSNPT